MSFSNLTHFYIWFAYSFPVFSADNRQSRAEHLSGANLIIHLLLVIPLSLSVFNQNLPPFSWRCCVVDRRLLLRHMTPSDFWAAFVVADTVTVSLDSSLWTVFFVSAGNCTPGKHITLLIRHQLCPTLGTLIQSAKLANSAHLLGFLKTLLYLQLIQCYRWQRHLYEDIIWLNTFNLSRTSLLDLFKYNSPM